MPELPEVETTVNELKPYVTGKQIKSVDVFSNKTIAEPSVEKFRKGLISRKIVSLSRRGKNLIFELDNGKYLVVHMRMTGSLLLKPETEEPGPFIRVVIYLNDKMAIHFRDMRIFGKMWLVEDKNQVIGKLGPEPLEPEFTPEVLARILDDKKSPIKPLLLDQTLIAGIGNMYADEALFDARLHPLRPANSLSKAEIKRLYDSIQKVLRKGIRFKGASIDTYIRPEGIKGGAQLEFQVAHRKGKECPLCGGKVERITVGQRGTFFCPRCQILSKGRTKPQKSKVKSPHLA